MNKKNPNKHTTKNKPHAPYISKWMNPMDKRMYKNTIGIKDHEKICLNAKKI